MSDLPKDPLLSHEPVDEGLTNDSDVHDEASSIAGETLEQVGAAGGETPPVDPVAKVERSTGRSAFMVGAGILISRIVGLARQRVFAHYFGTSAAGDAFSAAFRIPNFLQNIFVFGKDDLKIME